MRDIASGSSVRLVEFACAKHQRAVPSTRTASCQAD